MPFTQLNPPHTATTRRITPALAPTPPPPPCTAVLLMTTAWLGPLSCSCLCASHCVGDDIASILSAPGSPASFKAAADRDDDELDSDTSLALATAVVDGLGVFLTWA